MHHFVFRMLGFWAVFAVGLVTWSQESATRQQSDLAAEIEFIRADWHVPGLAVAVIKDDHIVFEGGAGVLECDQPAPVDEHTLFAIASNTKAFTAAAIAMLVEEDKIAWDDPVRKHLPYFELADPQVSAAITVRDLLCHRSGLGTFSGDLLWFGTPYDTREILRRARFLKPAGTFRASYGYQNLMYLAAGAVVESASGTEWPVFLRKRFFEPLGMDRTVTSVSDLAGMDNIATPHKTTENGSVPIEWCNWDSMAAAGGIISSVHDMTHWLRLQLRQGLLISPEVERNGTDQQEKRLFTKASSSEMWTPQVLIPISQESLTRFPSVHFRAYGLGWSLNDYLGRKVVSHGGGYDGMFSRVTLIPEEHLGIVVLTNSMTGIANPVTMRIVDEFLGAPETDWNAALLEDFRKERKEFRDRIERATHAEPTAHPASLPLENYAGTFRSKLYGDVTVQREETGLVLRLLPNPQLVADLTHLHYDTFVIHWREDFAWFDEGTAQFVLDANGKVHELKLNVPNDDLWFHELELPKVTPAATP